MKKINTELDSLTSELYAKYDMLSKLEQGIKETEKDYKRTLVRGIKKYMNDNQFTTFYLPFFGIIDRIDEKFRAEFDELLDKNADEISEMEMSDCEVYTYLSIEDDKLLLHWTGDYCRDDDRDFSEGGTIKYVDDNTLESIFNKLQNQDFHRMNELIAASLTTKV